MAITAPIRTCNGRFYDRKSREVILHGINLVNKNPQVGYLGPEDEQTFAAFKSWGFNCIRLGVIWDGLEPQPGEYNQAYLQGIQRQLDWAHDNDLYVIIDMHQDLYSVLYSDGAPAWATLHEGQPHVTGEVWSDAYFESPAVQTALDNFWRNAPAPDGIGLQDHFAACWKLLAERFGDHSALIGYDLLNEPVPGADSPAAMGAIFARAAQLLSQAGIDLAGAGPEVDASPDEIDPAQGLMAQWMNPEGRFQILGALSDPQIYTIVADAPQSIYNSFERERLMPFYQKVAAAIRQIDGDGILFLETTMGANMGTRTAIEPLALNNQRDPQQAYAPHGYDLVVDTANIAQASAARVGVIFNRHAETAQKHDWPMLVGEWGAFGFWDATLPAARQVVRLFEDWLCSDTYWVYEPSIEAASCFPALNRPYPERIAGELTNYHYDPLTGQFTCTWTESPIPDAPSVIYLPGWLDFDPSQATLTPSGEYRVENMPGGAARLHIRPASIPVQRTLVIQP